MRNRIRALISGITLVLVMSLGSPTVLSRVQVSLPDGGSVTIVRDEYGAPHVFGETLEAVWFGVGYAQAQDRLWQAELLRRSATGTSAEILGPAALESDKLSRIVFGSTARRAALFEAAAPETKIIFKSLAAGINAWIDKATEDNSLPPQYGALGVTPRDWTVDDSIAEAMLLLKQLGEFGSDELTNFAALKEFEERFGLGEAQKLFLDTHWSNDPSATTSVPTEEPATVVSRVSARPTFAAGFHDGVAQARSMQNAWQRHLLRVGLSHEPKSNAVVIGPKLSADGHALLLGGPQIGHSIPQITHEMGIHGAGFDVTGMNIAGLPGIPVGVGRRHAWSLTAGFSKNNYIYVEKVNALNQYSFNGKDLDFDCRAETIVVRGAATPVIQPVCESIHGPVIATDTGVAFTLKTAVRGLELQGVKVFHDMMRASNINQFERALSRAVYNFNVLYADAGGNIGYWHIGKIPIPAAGDNIWLPRDGTGSMEWQGFVPFAQMPRALNPERGWLASWNNKPSRDWNNSVGGFGTWGPVHRGNTLPNLLKDLTPRSATLETLEQINRTAGFTTDTPSGTPFNVFVSALDPMLQRVNIGVDPRLSEVWALLDAWDGLQEDENHDGLYDSPAVAIFNTWWQKMMDAVFKDDLGNAFQANVAANLAYRLVVPDPAVPLLHDYLAGKTVEDAVTASLVSALDELEAKFGSADPADWHQPAAQIVWEPFGAPELPQSACKETTVICTPWMNRGTYNQLVHLGSGSEMYGKNVVAPGQSGHPASPHFTDQLQLYATWRYKPMRLDRQDLSDFFDSAITLSVDPD